uniref:Uncharacterized protein n=1 Tax=Anguilla anguilla TaxID=7936 RepID=A0A0E9USQ1_ANGAN
MSNVPVLILYLLSFVQSFLQPE